MPSSRFPFMAFNRRLAEARTLPDDVLLRWLDDRVKAKRLAARSTLRMRGVRFLNDGQDRRP
jgi:hypothetical protein